MSIVPLLPKPSAPSADDAWHRRLALQIAVQLPEKPQEALIVLRYTEMLVRSFLTEPAKPA